MVNVDAKRADLRSQAKLFIGQSKRSRGRHYFDDRRPWRRLLEHPCCSVASEHAEFEIAPGIEGLEKL
jgi:hypothetical protein